jgi:hypothetical protein
LLFSSSPRERIYDNHNGTETVYTTEYRTVEKQYGYSVVQVSAQKNIQGKVSAALNDQIFNTDFIDAYQFRADRHDQNFPEAGLKPQQPRVISHQEWLSAIAPITLFCFEPLKKTTISEREQMHRCAEQVEIGVPVTLQEFYKLNHEVTFEGWKSIVR